MEEEVKHNFLENVTPFNVHKKSSTLILITSEKMKTFFRVNFIMGINDLTSISHYWDWNNIIGNPRIQKIFTCSHFQNISQNLHFANNGTADHIDKAYKVRTLKRHLNSAFIDAF